MKKICLKIIGIIAIVTVIVSSAIIMANSPSNALTDSGWDTDYGGSSWSSGNSSHDYGTSHDYGSSRDYNYHDYDYGGTRTTSSSSSFSSDDDYVVYTIVGLIFVFVLVEVVFALKRKTNYVTDNELYKKSIGDADNDIQQFFPDMTEEKMVNILYKKFTEIQKSWMNFDYQNLEKLCSNELYSSYKSDLEILKEKNGQNIMSNFKLIHANINGITEENGIISVKMFLHVSFYDYVINTTTEEVTRGNKNEIIHNQYILTFITKKQDNAIKCPSCGSDIEKGATECSYCHTVINHNYDDFVLSNKTKV